MFKYDSLLVPDKLSELDRGDENISNYAKYGIEDTTLLAFRDVPHLIDKYIQGKKTLDYGCGAGRSTRFLKSLGLDVIGADINEKFLRMCRGSEEIHYCKIENGKLPFIDEFYDFVFSSLVFLAIPTKEGIRTALNEIHRVLKKDGVLIIVTGAEKLHSPEMEWISYETKFPENRDLSRGQMLKLFIKKAKVTFYDYFWSNSDYVGFFEECGFQLLETQFPLGKQSDGCSWISEKEHAPFSIYILKKN